MTARVAIVQLAAGQSRRMGAANKLLLPIAGRPLVARTAEILLRLRAGPVTVVLGFEAERVAAVLAGLDVATVVNPDHAAGQAGSVRAGLNAAPAAQATLVVPSDQPRLSGSECATLIAAHRAGAAGRITVPYRHGRDGTHERGMPVVIPADLRARIVAGGLRGIGCGGLTREHPDLVHWVEMAGEGCFLDLDTPEDVERERARRAAAIWGEDSTDERIAARPLAASAELDG